MSRKDYVAIAAAIKSVGETDDWFTANRIAQAIADVLAADNPRFDRARFLEAARVEGTLYGA